MTPIDYESSDAPTQRPRVAWLPALCLAIVSTTPWIYAKTADWSFADVMQDFGLKTPTTTSNAIAALSWYLSGYGWVYAAILVIAAAIVTPRCSAVVARPSKPGATGCTQPVPSRHSLAGMDRRTNGIGAGQFVSFT